jgi:hypothetical protein
MEAMWRFAESRLAWFGTTVVALAAFVVATALLDTRTRTLTGGTSTRWFAASTTTPSSAVIDRIASANAWLSSYARSFARRRVTLLARRMQAELRTMDDCRFDRLAPWLEDGVTIDADGTVQAPAWAHEPEDRYPEPGRLRCVH